PAPPRAERTAPAPLDRSLVSPISTPARPIAAPAPGIATLASPAATEVGVEAFLPGGEWRDERGTVYVHERLRSEIEKPRGHWGRLEAPAETEPDLVALHHAGLGRALFLDLETGGLSCSPVFLAGLMYWNGETFVLRQYFARHYGEEAP